MGNSAQMKNYLWNEWDINVFKTLSSLQNDPTKELIHNRMGRLYWVWKNDALYIQRFARENGPYQGRNLKFLRKLKPDARTIVDVGMNVANNTMEYATWAQTVHGFEPFPETYNLAKENIELNQHVELKGRYWDTRTVKTLHNPNHPDGWFKQLNGTFASLSLTANIVTHNEGLGNVPGIMEMEHHPNNAGHNCIVTEDRKAKTKYDLHQVQVKTLDSYNMEEVDIIKIDCEGYEYPILQGAEQTIRRCRPIVQLEIVESQCTKFGYTPDDMWNFFINTIGNYGVYDFKGKRLPDNWLKIKGVMDRFFVPLELANLIDEDKSNRRHPGMGDRGFGKKNKNKTHVDTLFEEIKS
jgi:FkbM family methyltransferase